MSEKELEWQDIRNELNITKEEEREIQLEIELIEAIIEARRKNEFSQRDLSKMTGIKQPAIARIERRLCSPNTATLIKLLYPMGYTIKVVPLKEKNK